MSIVVRLVERRGGSESVKSVRLPLSLLEELEDRGAGEEPCSALPLPVRPAVLEAVRVRSVEVRHEDSTPVLVVELEHDEQVEELIRSLEEGRIDYEAFKLLWEAAERGNSVVDVQLRETGVLRLGSVELRVEVGRLVLGIERRGEANDSG